MIMFGESFGGGMLLLTVEVNDLGQTRLVGVGVTVERG